MHVSRHTSDLTDFLQLWRQLYDTLKGFDKEKVVTREEDDAFLELKSTIARYQSRLSVAYGLDNHFTDMVMGVINQVVSLKDYATMSPSQIKKIDNDWHHLFILLNGQIGIYDSSQTSASDQHFFVRLIKNPMIILLVLVAIIVGGYIIGKQFMNSGSQVEQEAIISYDE